MPRVLPARPMPTGTPCWKPPVAHDLVGSGNRAGGGDHQAKREFGCRVERLGCAACCRPSRPDACKPRRPPWGSKAPVIPIMRSLGRRRMRLSGKAVRSRIVRRMSKSASARAASSSEPKASAKNTSSARAASLDQSALFRATSCQSSRIAIFRFFSRYFVRSWAGHKTRISEHTSSADPSSLAALLAQATRKVTRSYPRSFQRRGRPDHNFAIEPRLCRP